MNPQFRSLKSIAASLVLISLIMPLFGPLVGPALEVVRAAEPIEPPSSTGLYRTRVTYPNAMGRARLDQLGVVVLEEVTDGAVILADDVQMETLARLRFRPQASEDLGLLVNVHAETAPWLAESVEPLLARSTSLQGRSQASTYAATAARQDLRVAMHALTAEQAAGIASLTAIDDDGDGLTNTEESWWCTDPLEANSDGDAYGYTDGEEVAALLDFTLSRTERWNYGPPFGPPNAWPDFNGQDGDPATPACNDGDFDTIPDLAEAYMVGTRVGTGDSENTDGDKFDDGQELFGTTYCPGGDDYCGYGSYPRTQDYSFISNAMPSWTLDNNTYLDESKIELSTLTNE